MLDLDKRVPFLVDQPTDRVAFVALWNGENDRFTGTPCPFPVNSDINVCKNQRPAAPTIRVIPNLSSEKQPFEDLARQHDGLFATEPVDPPKDVPDARLIAVRMADGVTLLGDPKAPTKRV